MPATRSKTLSEPKANPPPPKGLVVFVDRSCGGYKIPEAFRSLGFLVEVHRDHFPDDADDKSILHECGRRGWIYVAKDLAVNRNPAELQALTEAQIHAIFLHGAQKPAEWLIANLRAAANKIAALLNAASSPQHVAVMAGGRIAVLNRDTPPARPTPIPPV